MNGASPSSDNEITQVLETLHAECAGRRVAVVASGDMSHVGAVFGGDPLSPADRVGVRADDDVLIKHMRQADAQGFFQSIHHVHDRNNVCGVSPIYLTLRLLGATQGELHGYASCPADNNDTSAVTICGMIFH